MYIYFGSDAFSLAVLQGLCAHTPPMAIVTQPDRPAGRKQQLQAGPLAKFAKERQIPLFQPDSLKSEDQQKSILDLKAQLFIVVSFGQILPKSFLNACPPIINGHASLLPKYRGASPIQSVLLNGEEQTGMTIMHIVPALDAGPMIAKKIIDIEAHDNHGSLSEKLIGDAIELLMPFAQGQAVPQGEEQDHTQATHCSKLSKEDALLDPRTQSDITMDRRIRAFAPDPSAHLFFQTAKGPKRLKIHRASFEPRQGEVGIYRDGKQLFLNGFEGQSLLIHEIQPEGKAVMSSKDFLNGVQGELRLV